MREAVKTRGCKDSTYQISEWWPEMKFGMVALFWRIRIRWLGHQDNEFLGVS
jgi:hypothetical protein